MLSLDSRRYQIPRRVDSGWEVEAENETRIIRQPFNYTLYSLKFRGVHYEGKYTFIYDGNSVRPTYRTLRVYGAEQLQPIISALSRKRKRCQESGVSEAEEERRDGRIEWFRATFTSEVEGQLRLVSEFEAKMIRAGLRAKGEWDRDAENIYRKYYI